MVQHPLRDTSTTIIATPGSGPIPYWRKTFAPAMKVSPGYTGTLLACTSEDDHRARHRLEHRVRQQRHHRGDGTHDIERGLFAALRHLARIFWIRAVGSTVPTGAARFTPANRLPPAGSESDRRFTGTAMGSVAIGTPSAS